MQVARRRVARRRVARASALSKQVARRRTLPAWARGRSALRRRAPRRAVASTRGVRTPVPGRSVLPARAARTRASQLTVTRAVPRPGARRPGARRPGVWAVRRPARGVRIRVLTRPVARTQVARRSRVRVVRIRVSWRPVVRTQVARTQVARRPVVRRPGLWAVRRPVGPKPAVPRRVRACRRQLSRIGTAAQRGTTSRRPTTRPSVLCCLERPARTPNGRVSRPRPSGRALSERCPRWDEWRRPRAGGAAASWQGCRRPAGRPPTNPARRPTVCRLSRPPRCGWHRWSGPRVARRSAPGGRPRPTRLRARGTERRERGMWVSTGPGLSWPTPRGRGCRPTPRRPRRTTVAPRCARARPAERG